MKKAKAFQDSFPDNACFGCGPHNIRGNHIKSYWKDETKKEMICIWKPRKYHTARDKNILHGGIIASVIDCSAVWAATAIAYDEENRDYFSDPLISYETSRIDVRYLRHAQIEMEITILIARDEITRYERRSIIRAKLFANGLLCAVGKVTVVRI